jgi:hypothetical protein
MKLNQAYLSFLTAYQQVLTSLRLFQNSESLQRATLDVHEEKLHVFINRKTCNFSSKAGFKRNRLLKSAPLRFVFSSMSFLQKSVAIVRSSLIFVIFHAIIN